jgi:hypothetical protein
MAKREQSPPEEGGTFSPEGEVHETENGITEKIKKAFDNFPTVDTLYHDGKEVYFSPVKPGMKAVKRSNFFKKIDK